MITNFRRFWAAGILATLLPWSPKWASKAVVEYAPQTMCPDVKH